MPRPRSFTSVWNGDWYRVGDCDGYYVQVDSTDPDIVYAAGLLAFQARDFDVAEQTEVYAQSHARQQMHRLFAADCLGRRQDPLSSAHAIVQLLPILLQ